MDNVALCCALASGETVDFFICGILYIVVIGDSLKEGYLARNFNCLYTNRVMIYFITRGYEFSLIARIKKII